MHNFHYYILILGIGITIVACQKDDPISSCSDGIQNGTELGVDCGGDCAACAESGCTNQDAHNYNSNASTDDGSCETCSDGIQNGDEEEVDCGGDLCNPCQSEIQKFQGLWRQLTHTEGGVDQRALFDVDDVFYHFIEGSTKYEQLNVQKNEEIKNFFVGSYDVDVSIDQVSRTINSTTYSFRYTLLGNNQLRLEGSIGGHADIQTFEKIDTDLCLGIICGLEECLFGYCL